MPKRQPRIPVGERAIDSEWIAEAGRVLGGALGGGRFGDGGCCDGEIGGRLRDCLANGEEESETCSC